MSWKLAWFSLAVISVAVALWIAWEWSQNGRWHIPQGRSLVIDTRTGDVYTITERRVRLPAKQASPR